MSSRGGTDGVLVTISYVIIVLAKYVQMMTQYHIFRNELQRLEIIFKELNDNMDSYSKSYKDITGEELNLNTATKETLDNIKMSLDKEWLQQSI